MNKEKLKKQIQQIQRKIDEGDTVTVAINSIDDTRQIAIGKRKVYTETPGEDLGTFGIADGEFSPDFTLDVSAAEISEEEINHVIEQQLKSSQLQMETTAKTDENGLPIVVLTRSDVEKLWILFRSCSYKVGNHTITAPASYRTDLASIPRIFWSLISPEELSLAAPLFHDLIYRSAGELSKSKISPFDGKVFTRHEADEIFLEIMKKAKITRWKRTVAYWAVRAFASFAWVKRDLSVNLASATDELLNTVSDDENFQEKSVPHELAGHDKEAQIEETETVIEKQVGANEVELETEVRRPWRVAKSLLILRRQVNRRAPNRSKASDGTIGDDRHRRRTSDHNAWIRDGSHDVVSAMDITHDPARGCSAEEIAEALRGSRDRRIKYVIWNRRIFSATISAWRWRRYTGENPHTKHIHISVNSNKTHYDSIDQWSI